MSKYTFFNKIIPDDKLISHLVSQMYEDFGFTFHSQMDEIKDLSVKILNKYKIEIKYLFVDFEEEDVKSKYGLKKNTDVVAIKYPSNYLFVFNKKNGFNNNRYLFLKALAYILFDRLETNEEIRLSLELAHEKNEELAEKFACEFLIPKWKYNILKDLIAEFDEAKLIESQKHLNKHILEVRKNRCVLNK